MRISKLDKIANTDRYVFYMPALSDKFAVFLNDEGQTMEFFEATRFRLEDAYTFRTNWEKANPGKGHLIIVPDETYPSVKVIPVGYLDKLVTDYN
jgi:hypothetical protein